MPSGILAEGDERGQIARACSHGIRIKCHMVSNCGRIAMVCILDNWPMDLMRDSLVSRHRVRTLNIIDDANRNRVAIEIDV